MLPSPEKSNVTSVPTDGRGPHSFSDTQPIIDQVLATCGLGKMLDVGCGTGQLVCRLLEHGVDAYGVDAAGAPIAEANRRVGSRYQIGSVLHLPYEPESFDTILSIACLEHLAEADIPPALSELYRVAKRFLYARLTTHDRTWWETRFFAAGFRRHPLLLTAVGFQSLDTKPGPITLLFEKIPQTALQKYPRVALRAEHNLPMDALRESGPRSDAAIACYSLAKDYIRPNDVVLDLACGLGYGSAILWDGSEATKVIGFDASLSAVEYAQANFYPQRPTLEFRQGDVGKLSAFPDESVDLVVSFETIENLKEVRRLLKPGCRLICSGSNAQFDLSKLTTLVGEHLLVEQIFAQIAPSNGHRLVEVTAGAPPLQPEAERWLLVAMKDPVAGDKKNYVETAFLTGLKQELNIMAFARDYRNPWLVRSMVTIGQRCRSTVLLRELARRVLESAPFSSADAGAALCVSGYLQLESPTPDPQEREQLIDQLHRYANSAGKTAHAARWRISNQYLLAKLLLSVGQIDRAREEFWKCARMDCLVFSPLLATKTVDAAFWAGWLALLQQRPDEARNAWRHGLREAQRVLSGSWQEIVGNPDSPLLFGLREATLILDAATCCSNGLYTLDHSPQRPGYSATFTLYSLSNNSKHQQGIIAEQKYWIKTLSESKAWLEQQNAGLLSWTQELDRARNWLEEQRSTWQHTAEEGGKLTQQQSEWSQKLEQAKVWLDQQAANWRQAAEKSGQVIEEQRAWMKSLEHGKNWLEQERDRWHQLAEERGQTIQQQHQKLELLEQNHTRVEGQRADWQRLASDKDKTIQEHLAALQSLEQQIEASRALVADKEKAIEQQRASIRSLEQRLGDSQAAVADRDKALQQHAATIQSLERQLDATRMLVQKLEAAQRNLSEALQKLQSDFAALQQQMERQRVDLQSKIGRRETHLRDLEKRFFYRALVWLKLLPPPFVSEGESDSGEKRPNER
jgi:ubiquinone/menaquinone biosynthesis C-methylase UbiE/ABC-type transporter Mla subunit MlaD